MHDADDERAVGEVVEYCRTQAGLLAGRVETMAAEAESLIDEIDEGVADLRTALDDRDRTDDGDGAAGSDDTGSEDGDDDVGDLSAAESELQRKHATVEATETRMRLFQDLASDYLDLADDLLADYESGEADADDAVHRVVAFEAERDAPAYFEERETLVETARRGRDDDAPVDPETSDLETDGDETGDPESAGEETAADDTASEG
ncbi:hypothetical protein [Halobaculum lipolyticum]|uniref:Uncharacterized protein n=1 Tax=Halobaculum lipolyticum TaxID=3032001 RepID=A0ABD5WAM8_9EURY|nr:hypothetical protein [Halobaculum sp. DT31]